MSPQTRAFVSIAAIVTVTAPILAYLFAVVLAFGRASELPRLGPTP